MHLNWVASQTKISLGDFISNWRFASLGGILWPWIQTSNTPSNPNTLFGLPHFGTDAVAAGQSVCATRIILSIFRGSCWYPRGATWTIPSSKKWWQSLNWELWQVSPVAVTIVTIPRWNWGVHCLCLRDVRHRVMGSNWLLEKKGWTAHKRQMSRWNGPWNLF